MAILLSACLLFISITIPISAVIRTDRYQPTWDSLDSRPLPDWYDDAKVGIFIHWGVFSVPAFGSEWFWWNWKGVNQKEYIKYMEDNYKPNFTYQEFAPQFTARFYDPDYWASLFQDAGAKYIVLTSKHHEGYTLWPSNVSWNWNAMDVGPKRDLLGELAVAVRKTDVRFGVYHSLFEFFNPLFRMDSDNNYTTRLFAEAKTIPELNDLVNTYKPDVIWSDGDWNTTDTYWTSKEWLAWLYNDSPVKDTVVTNDRWGSGVMCNHGGVITCQDRYNPGKLQKRKWENAMTIDKKSWGYVKTSKSSDYLTIQEIITTLVQTVSYGGNLLINVGPTSEGTIPPIMEDRLRQMGKWLKMNGESIYATKPWVYQNDTYAPSVYFTEPKESKVSTVYAIVLEWPEDNILGLGSVTGKPNSTIVEMIGPNGVYIPLEWAKSGPTFIIALKPIVSDQWGWVLRITNPVPS